MKYLICLILTFLVNAISFSQNKYTVENDIKEITNYLKEGNLISFFKKHQSYKQLVEDYLKNGDTLRYKRMSDSSEYKFNNAMYSDNIIRNFLNCKKIFIVEGKKIKIDWKHSLVKEVLIEESRISIDKSSIDQEMFVPAKVLVSNSRDSSLVIVDISLIYSKSGKLMSFRILENIHIGFPSIKESVKFENEKMEKLLKNAVLNESRNSLKRIDNTEDPAKQYQKTYVSENNNADKLILTFETKENTTLLRLVNRVINGNLKYNKSFGQWENWEGIVVFNPYGSETTWYMYENSGKIICFSIDAYITDIDKMRVITFSQIKDNGR